VAMAINRLDYVLDHSGTGGTPWTYDLTPSESLRRNFYFCMIDDPGALDQRHMIGIDHILFETDFPHADSTWPSSQDLLRKRLAGIPHHEAVMIAGGNAAKLFRQALPEASDWPAIPRWQRISERPGS
jgi:Amidohydrolase